jgi:hypothetical protein
MDKPNISGNYNPLVKNPGINPMVWMIITNMIPLAGVCFAGWDTLHVIGLYWCETAMIGILNIPKILMAQKGQVDLLNKIFTTVISGLVYGLFILAQGTFIFIIVAFTMDHKPDLNNLKYGVLALVVNSLISFYNNYIVTEQYKTTNPDEEMFAPIKRIMGQQFFTIGGLCLIFALGLTDKTFDLTSKLVIILFIAMKIFMEYRSFNTSKKKLSAG